MNILILCTHLNPAGISRYVINLAKGLTRNSHKVYVASSGGKWADKLKAESIPFKPIPIQTKSICSLKILFSLISLLPFIRREKIQIIHANTRVTQYLGYLLYKFYAIPYVCTFHGFHKPKFLRKLYKFSGVRTIAVSEAVKKHLVQDFAVGKEKIRVVYNGIDPQEFNQKTTEKTDFGYKKTDFVIGLLGRISQEKGHFLAVEAFRLLLAAHNNIYLAISGPGRLKNKLQSFVKSFQLESRVKFLDLEAKDFLSIIDLLLVPSKKEGFGYSIIEAFAKNVAVVAFNTGGIPEIIKNKENGILFYQYDAISLHSVIEELLLNQELRNRISACATRTLNNFSIEKMALATAEVYAECLK